MTETLKIHNFFRGLSIINCMTRPLSLSGRVEKGEGMATRLGCPTANIAVEQGATIPAMGVYIGETEVEDVRYPSLICISDGRTGYNLKMEVHLLDQEGIELSEKRINVVLFEKLRDVIPFPGEEVMTAMIKDDLIKARQWFASSSQI
jgi:riboflavin kinase/FMN adenylyltransferase